MPQEYYEEESIVELYQNVLERLLIAFADDESLQLTATYKEHADLTVHQERLRIWPPRPWPPWGPEDPDDPDDGDHKPINRTEEAKKLAKGVVMFERKIANASLDL